MLRKSISEGECERLDQKTRPPDNFRKARLGIDENVAGWAFYHLRTTYLGYVDFTDRASRKDVVLGPRWCASPCF